MPTDKVLKMKPTCIHGCQAPLKPIYAFYLKNFPAWRCTKCNCLCVSPTIVAIRVRYSIQHDEDFENIAKRCLSENGTYKD